MGFATPLAHWSINDKNINNLIEKELEPKKISELFDKVPKYIMKFKELDFKQRNKYHSKIWLFYCWSKFINSL